MSPNDSNVTCIRIQDEMPDMVDNSEIQFLFGTIFTLIFIIGVLGNGLVFFGIVKKTNTFSGIRLIFVGNLTVANLLVATASLPVTSIQIFTRNWIFGSHSCKIVPGVQSAAIFATSLTQAAIAIDRFQTTRLCARRANKGQNAPRQEWAFVAGTWAVSVTLAMPYVFILKLFRAKEICGEFCEEFWPEPRQLYKRIYGLGVLVVQFLAPTLISGLCYAVVYKKVRKQSLQRASMERLSVRTLLRLETRKNRVLRISILLVAAFIFSWLPINYLNVARDIGISIMLPHKKWYSLCFAVAHVFAMSSIIWNPIVHFFSNYQLRAGLGSAISLGDLEVRATNLARKISGRVRAASTTQAQLPPAEGGEICTGVFWGNDEEGSNPRNNWYLEDDQSTTV